MPAKEARDVINNLAFVKNHGVEIFEVVDGITHVRMPYQQQYSTLPAMFPTAMVGLVGDVAAIGACFAALPAGYACATLDYTVKNTGLAEGDELYAEGKVLMTGKTITVGSADVYVRTGNQRRHCGTVLATGRVYQARDKRPASDKG